MLVQGSLLVVLGGREAYSVLWMEPRVVCVQISVLPHCSISLAYIWLFSLLLSSKCIHFVVCIRMWMLLLGGFRSTQLWLVFSSGSMVKKLSLLMALKGPYVVLGIEPASVACKVIALCPEISLKSMYHNNNIFMIKHISLFIY